MEESTTLRKLRENYGHSLFEKLAAGPLKLFSPHTHGWSPAEWARTIGKNLEDIDAKQYYNILADFKEWAMISNNMESYGRAIQASCDLRFYNSYYRSIRSKNDMEMCLEPKPNC
jgi:hypothetical protein